MRSESASNNFKGKPESTQSNFTHISEILPAVLAEIAQQADTAIPRPSDEEHHGLPVRRAA